MQLLTKRELQIMNTLWHADKALSAKDISTLAPEISMNTILSVLRKLLKQNIIKTDSIAMSGSTLMRKYAPVLQESAYLTSAASDKALHEIVTGYIDDQDSTEDLDALEKLIQQRKNKLK
ncbi:BlaI/MecI/CopY family transcriptional regulator [Lacticaseibacillus zhaodongensis]|uniref:BlaI/MecI/CopY family transcriptional regulator n=1 Tax=Lacticaseibacillus zhaodongensis TaxID=2668065 RepID=UPI0012D351C3|nr:BlaI/MecI/CopY family transcriptional regulator [Lacticaseibacillus zhaodongensis]